MTDHISDPVARTTATGEVVFPGHLGIIYQASNAAYLGRATARTLRLLPDGRVINDRALAKLRAGDQGRAYVERLLIGYGARPMRVGEERRRWLAEALVQAKVRTLRHGGNHRYAFRIGPFRRLISLGLDAASYPKAAAKYRIDMPIAGEE